MNTSLVRLLGVSLFFFALHSALSQGSLTPPGAPTPTMKTLTQIEPRTAIASAVTISVPGSYYLTNNIAVAGGDAITIAASGVTLDLNGFTVSSTAPGATGTGILISGNRRNITISNGFIEGSVLRSGAVFSGNGFGNGIYIAAGQPVNVLVSRVSVSGILGEGIDLGTGESTFVDSCTVRIAGGNGIVAGVVRDCVVRECGLDGVTGISVDNCSALVTGSGTAIKATNALNCHGTSFSGGKGIDAFSASNCRGIAFGTGSTGINAVIATACTATGDGIGIFATTVQDCSGTGGGNGTGIRAVTAHNCRGISEGNGFGIDAANAQNCDGTSNSGTGLFASVAFNCYGLSTTGSGLSFITIGAMCGGRRLSPLANNYVLGGGLAGPVSLP